MKMFNPDDIMLIMYIDQVGIDGIYHQFQYKLVENKISSTDQIATEIGGTAQANGLLKVFGSFETTAMVNGNHDVVREQSIEIQYENKVKYLLDELFDSKVASLFDCCTQEPRTKLVACKGLFRLKGAFDNEGKTWVDATTLRNQSQLYSNLSFNFGSFPELIHTSDTKSITEAEQDRNTTYVDLLFSSNLLTRNVRHLTYEIRFGSDFMFSIIGELNNVGKNNYYLKPYVIWKTSDRNI